QRMALNQGVGQLQLGNNSLVAVTANIFPASKLGALGLINNGSLRGLGYICLFLVTTFVGFYLFLLLGNLLYYKGVNGVSVASSRRKELSGEQLSRQTMRSSVLKSYLVKELRILLRTPAYFINCILMNFLWPILLLIPILTQPKTMGEMSRFTGLLQNEKISGIVLVVAFGLMLFVSASNGIAATAISREGESISFDKYIPVSYETQIMAKVISGVLLGVVGMLAICSAGEVLLKLTWSLLGLICLTSLLAILFSNLVGLWIDLFNPKLHWSDEQKAVKQNMNLLVAMAICVLFGGLTAYVIINLKLSAVEASVALVVGYGVLDALLLFGLARKGADLFSKIEY
ncbi:MAG: hypothetical protein M0Z55_05010, partial [Peptococcaceae bacterium]|nr:hypothetical protein [Peptococcaceae bacterium]